MKDFFGKLAGFFAKTWVWSLCLVLALSLLVWFAGPYFAVAEVKFWEPAVSRLVTISVLMLCWGLGLVFSHWRANRRQQAEASDEAVQQQQLQQEVIDEEQGELQRRFKDALRTIRRSSLYRGRSERWRNDLPWYLLIGPQGAGKTSLLDFSGVEFPLNREQQKLTRDIGGTRYCDWYFADHGVLLDTAGRYLSHEESAVDKSAWQGLLGLLRKRRARPLNGVLVVLPVESLLSHSELALENLARQTRQRLHEVHERLGAEVPVYLVLSKSDQLSGFDEFFDQLSREESDQVLGTSFRVEQNGADAQTVRQEFEELLRRLNSQVIMRVHQERDQQRRGRILDFPHQLGQLGEPLCLFVELAFSGNRYQRASKLRGFYLTSAPSVASGMDAQTASIGRNLGLDRGLLPTYQSGRARFIKQLLTEVIFPEADLATLDKREVNRISWGQRALYAAAIVGVSAMAALWALGFNQNHTRLQNLEAYWLELRDMLGAQQGLEDAEARLPLLDKAYAASLEFPRSADEALWRRAGLYQGEQVNPELHQHYRHVLASQLLPQVAAQLEGQVRANRQDRETLLNSLRAYLMLNMHERLDADFLKEWLAADWSQRYPGDNAVQSGLNGHFERLLSESFAPYPLDNALVAEARAILRSESLANVVYRELRARSKEMAPLSFDQVATGFRGGDYRIPGLYTQRGYKQVFISQGGQLLRDILRDNWVLGDDKELSVMDMRRLMAEVEALYFRDYASHWSDAVNRLELLPVLEAEQGATLLSQLTAADSPILAALKLVREHTQFKGLTDAAGEADLDAAGQLAKNKKLGKLAAQAAKKAQKSLADLPATARQSVEQRFAPLHQLLDDNAGPTADLAQAMQSLNSLQQLLFSVAHASNPGQTAFDLAKARMRGQSGAIGQLRYNAGRLPQPVGNWFSLTARESWNLLLKQSYGYLNRRYQDELYSFYASALDKRYPFAAHSDSEVALADFREFFKEQGVAQRFYEDYLKAFVSLDHGRYKLRRVDDMVLPVSRDFLAQLNRTQVIQRSFFAENPTEPQILFKLEPYSLDPTVGRADFRMADQQLEYRHGPIVQHAFRWPAQAGEARVSLTLEDLSGRRVAQEQNNGVWSLFRLLDTLNVDHFSGRDVLMVKADLGGLRANYLLHSQRSPNPFDLAQLRQFQLPAQL
ncbi:type VI secretion system membrane subunit TssM [Atopomonas sediminilitoris]|uniref:type VI secretion system membrane subunit TssM n=1 Tax=Atopomonas sediminilitoris TaxID=2919919 RepID=UPI001F4EC72A|nr:type VI secretion system membrane subunit TssM [Atopomonas sediminilitoris]MCJ8170442.1 type VI secretion system membrane subunit TssM [Atopomonas sediminilitoris]